MKNKEFITLHLTLRLRPWIYRRLVSLSYRGQLPLHKIVGWWIFEVLKIRQYQGKKDV